MYMKESGLQHLFNMYQFKCFLMYIRIYLMHKYKFTNFFMTFIEISNYIIN